ncbi:hypothetical protein [Solitalea lacus]|uniref:hypothetical protein n=1 Tax=Solitalea lacus TaxID=2911172 RepID=UPI001EDAF040|nr:hypothetical protein [Solitalea lacus]UKJ08768.1 hypothetical protein L2B55_06280 [Solitalea lacus]
MESRLNFYEKGHNAMIGELYKGFDHQKRMQYLNKAFSLAKTPIEKQFIQQQINASMH